MKKKLINIALLLCFAPLLLTSCNEELGIEVIPSTEFELSEFAPASAAPLASVSITGKGLGDVKKVYIVTSTADTIQLTVQEIITNSSIVCKLPHNARPGILHIDNGVKTAKNSTTLGVIYPQPQITSVPSQAKVGSEIEILGSNLHGVSLVTLGGTNANIRFNNGKELIVAIPFVLNDNVALTLTYASVSGNQEMTIKADFGVEKPLASISAQMPQNVKEGQQISIQGENLDLIETVMFGEIPASSLVKNANTLSFRVPTLALGYNTVNVVANYYSNTKTIDLRPACIVFVPEVFHYSNIVLGAHRQLDTGNLFCSEKGEVYSACMLKSAATSPDTPENIAALKSIDFSGYANAAGVFTIYAPDNTGSTLKNYWCDGKTFTTAGTIDALKSAGFSHFVNTQTRFYVLNEGAENQKQIIEDVRNGNITKISIDTYPDLFNGTINPTGQTVKWDPITSSSAFNVGSVVLFFNPIKNKRGLFLIKGLEGAGNAIGKLQFDVYSQR